MSSAGHVQDMINRFKDNKALNKRRREIHERMQDANEIKINRRINLKFLKKKASKSQLDKIREDIQHENAERKSKERIVFIIVLFVVALLVYGIFYGDWFSTSNWKKY